MLNHRKYKVILNFVKPVDQTYRPALGQLLWELDLCTTTLEVAALAKELVSVKGTCSSRKSIYSN